MERRKLVMARMRALVVAMIVFASVTGCGDVDFWGNPVPDPSAAPSMEDICETGSAPAPAYDPGFGGRPPDVRAGNSWIVVELEVRALSPTMDRDFCIPIAVHVYFRSGEADAVAIGPAGVESGPFDWITVTPLTNRFVALQYDPTEPRFQATPPRYEVHLDATYLRDRDTFNTEIPVALRCALKVKGATVVQDLALVDERNNVQCTLVGSDHWNRF